MFWVLCFCYDRMETMETPLKEVHDLGSSQETVASPVHKVFFS